MQKVEIKTIVQNLVIKTNKGFNTDLFRSDTEVIEDINHLDNLELYISIDYDTITDNQGNIIGQKETFIAYDKGDTYLITIQEKEGYQGGDNEFTIYSKWLTLQGYNYFTKIKIIENQNASDEDFNILEEMNSKYYEAIIAEAFNILIDYKELIEISEFKENYLQVKFDLEDTIYTINFNLKHQLTSMKKDEINKTPNKDKSKFQRRGNKC